MYEEQPRVIPGGHYVVVARVIEAKDLPSIKSFDLWQTVTSFSLKQATENSDALPNVTTKVKLSRAGFPQQKRKTIVEKETSQPLWNQCFYFEGMDLANEELDGCAVNFEVSDRRKFGKDATIGSVELECSKVFEEHEHKVWHRWYHLTDPSGKRQGSQGQVKICVQVLRRGDEEATMANMDPEDSDSDSDSNSDSDDDDEKNDKAKNKLAKKSFLASLMEKETDTPAEEGEIEIWAIKANVYIGKDLPRMDWPI